MKIKFNALSAFGLIFVSLALSLVVFVSQVKGIVPSLMFFGLGFLWSQQFPIVTMVNEDNKKDKEDDNAGSGA